ncbi:2'-5' RNA ligase family protein [Anaeromyxobacter oryzae]|uniref:2'-5' RNA ligase family protein n=1 Tax=Anaeromyxobacter oryzae TaxID=2918170 RepID=A0ABM7X1J5_9BACT|nr:2'-5' RNA ligase family protein [Anaeromyxobacter oryzae]BDG05645.1 hypothetical protein AMOR_46410 [Anaeromyxobacter oryzae]
MATTPQSALVLIPPPDVWPPIQAIRRVHDRQVRRWMPHVTLLYPFVHRAALEQATPAARAALGAIPPFEVSLGRFEVFPHRGGTFTVWLAPEPKEALVALHAALVRAFPRCDDGNRFAGGFTPHLSVGQARGPEALDEFQRELGGWMPVVFSARHVTIIVRDPPPHDVFRTFAEARLGEPQGD